MTLPSTGIVGDTPTQAALDAIRREFPLTGDNIATDAITATHLAPDSVDASEIATGAVGELEINDAYIVAGTYTPTLTNVTNITGSTASQVAYLRIGTTVVSGLWVTIDPTAAGGITLGVSLPIASNFGANGDAAGTAANINSNPPLVARLVNDSANNRLTLGSTVISTNDETWVGHFIYEII
jgi:hypothetical protein